ncbi:MAG: 2-iminoacetate synthase ThiH [Victivallaceae bacterium]|nr:2-iminoacetate synthase ThiH [Victivallaceae bacterium]
MLPYLKQTEEQITTYIAGVSTETVKSSLRKERRDFQDLLNLISPAAEQEIEQMRSIAVAYRKMHYGKAVRLYTPLYISNKCVNSCAYCDFSIKNKSPRKTLTLDEIIKEAKAIKALGMDSLLLVAGEDPKSMSIEFLEQVVKEMKKYFSYLSIEIFPLDTEGYKRLADAGVEGLTLYQETYNQELYLELHPAGPKRDYLSRVDAIAHGGKAGIRTLGVGFLLGLYDWRSESASLAAHAIWLRKHFWKSKIQFSFPRITPVGTGFQAPAPVSDEELEQMMLAFRIVFPEADMTISTRESGKFRDKTALSCAGLLSAESRVTPGGYADAEDKDVGQFMLNDTRSAEQIKDDLKKSGLEIVIKYWDKCI